MAIAPTPSTTYRNFPVQGPPQRKVRKRDRTVHARCLSIDGMEIDKHDYERIRELAMYRYHCCGFGWGKSDPIPKGHYEFANKSQYHAKFIVKEHNGEGQEREIELKPYLGKFKEEDTPHKRTINTNLLSKCKLLPAEVRETEETQLNLELFCSL